MGTGRQPSLALSPSLALCDLQQVFYLSGPQFPYMKNEQLPFFQSVASTSLVGHGMILGWGGEEMLTWPPEV